MADTYLGESIAKLGFGYMRLPRKGMGFDYEHLNKMVDAFLAQGFTYFDTAFVYTGSEEALCESLVKRHPREKYQIATKLPMMMIKQSEDMQTMFNTSLQRLGTDYVDFYLLHGLSEAANTQAEELGAWDFVKKLKAEGKIKHYGFSFHDTPENLDIILTRHPDAEFVQLQINYLDWDSEDVQSRKLYETARRHNIPVTIMEPVKGGLLSSEGSELGKVLKAADPNVSVASWAIRFAATLDGIITVLSGMNAMDQLEDNIKTVKNLKQMSDSELATLREAVKVLNSTPRIPCTGCRYCVENCPQKINIPGFLELYNSYLKYNSTANSEFSFMMATMGGGKPSACISCRVCEGHCPQHILISEVLSKIVPIYEK
jgi:uncharacterized protein